MKVNEKSVYQDVQNIFNKICQMKSFECAQISKEKTENINLWHYIWCECLVLMKKAKQIKIAERNAQIPFSFCNGKFKFDEMTYHDIIFLKKRKIVDKRMFVNCALEKAYHPFSVFDDGINNESDLFADNLEEENNIFTIVQKMRLLEFILITEKELHKRETAVRNLFSE